MVSTLLSAILQEFNHFHLQKLPHFMSSSQLWLPGCSKSAALWAYQKPKLSEMNNKTKNSCYFTVYWVVFFFQSWGVIQKVSWASQGSIMGAERAHWCRSDAVPTAMLPPSLECFPPIFSPHHHPASPAASLRRCARWKLMGWEAVWVELRGGERAQSTSRFSWMKYSNEEPESRLHLCTQVGRQQPVSLQGSW